MGERSKVLLSGFGLVKHFGGNRALAGMDFTVFQGESVAIMGASGSGKTTLLHCLAGITLPDSGEVLLTTRAGRVRINDPDEQERSQLRRERFGFVFQEGMLIPELTAVENVAIALMLTGVARRPAEAVAAEWLAHLGLAGMERRRIGELSGGQAQRVAIARAHVTGAQVVFADEPTGALDSRTSTDVMDVLLNTREGERALVVVTHDSTIAARCTRVVHLADGMTVPGSSADGGFSR